MKVKIILFPFYLPPWKLYEIFLFLLLHKILKDITILMSSDPWDKIISTLQIFPIPVIVQKRSFSLMDQWLSLCYNFTYLPPSVFCQCYVEFKYLKLTCKEKINKFNIDCIISQVDGWKAEKPSKGFDLWRFF